MASWLAPPEVGRWLLQPAGGRWIGVGACPSSGWAPVVGGPRQWPQWHSTGQFPLVAQPIAVAHARTGLAKVSPPCIPRPPRVPCLALPCAFPSFPGRGEPCLTCVAARCCRTGVVRGGTIGAIGTTTPSATNPAAAYPGARGGSSMQWAMGRVSPGRLCRSSSPPQSIQFNCWPGCLRVSACLPPVGAAQYSKKVPQR